MLEKTSFPAAAEGRSLPWAEVWEGVQVPALRCFCSESQYPGVPAQSHPVQRAAKQGAAVLMGKAGDPGGLCIAAVVKPTPAEPRVLVQDLSMCSMRDGPCLAPKT